MITCTVMVVADFAITYEDDQAFMVTRKRLRVARRRLCKADEANESEQGNHS